MIAANPSTGAPHVYLVAGEESGDRLGAALIGALRRADSRLRISGVGGGHMAAAGVPSLFPLGDLAIMGFSALPTKLPTILRRIRETTDAVIAANPDVLVIIDSPEFTHRVARKVRARAPRIGIVDYVCPSVWAWRSGRARAMRSYVDRVLALLPFEPAAVAKLGGPPTDYVGHPLIERLAELRPNEEETRRRISDPPLLLVLPGSRSGEIRRMTKMFGDTLALLAARTGPFEVVVPAVPRLEAVVREAVKSWSVPVRIVTDPAAKNAAFRHARAALTKSGTSTLELALAGVPMVAAYLVSTLEAVVGSLLIKAPSAILTNLILGENVVPEFLQWHCTPEKLAGALEPLLTDSPERRRQLAAFSRLDGIMEIGGQAPSDRAAGLILPYLQGHAGHAGRA